MSPPLVVAFALAGRADIDMTSEPLGNGRDGKPVFLRDVWPTTSEVRAGAARVRRRGDLPPPLRGPRRGESALEGDPGAHGHGLRVGPGVDLHPGAAVLRGLRRRRPLL